MRIRNKLYSTCVMLLFSISTSAADQESAYTEKKPILEEVYVTVSKRSESLLESLGSVSAISGEDIALNNVQDFRTLSNMIPGLVVTREEVGGASVVIRGISKSRNGPSPVAFHINDVFMDLNGEPYYDIEAVELIKGPSGIAYGRNATAGAINAKWTRPVNDVAAGGVLRQDEVGGEEVKGYVNVPLYDSGDAELLARFAFAERKKDGTIDNLLLDESADPNSANDNFYRLYLTALIADKLEVGVRAVRYESNPEGANIVFSPSLSVRRSGVLEELGAEELPDDLTKVRSLAHTNFGGVSDQFTRVSGDVRWSIEQFPILGGFDLILVGGELKREWTSVFDVDGTEEAIVEGISEHQSDIRRSVELRAVSNGDNGVNWIVGLFKYRKEDASSGKLYARQFVSPETLGLPSVPGFPSVPLDFKISSSGMTESDHSDAIFVSGDVDLSKFFDVPRIQLSGGVRLNKDYFRIFTEETSLSVDVAGNSLFAGLFPDSIGVVELGGETDIEQVAEFEEVTGEVGIRYFLSDTRMTYLRLARGYKPGLAQQFQTLTGEVVQNPVDPEYLNAIELGWKASYFDSLLHVTAAAYNYDYRGLQVTQFTANGLLTDNAAEATIRGFEADVMWIPSERWFVQAGLAVSDARYDKFCGEDPSRENTGVETGCNDENPYDFSGKRMAAAPLVATSLQISYRLNLNKYGMIVGSMQSSWSDEIDRRGRGNPFDMVDPYTNSSARVSWESPSSRFKLTAFVENIENNNDVFLGGGPVPVGSDRPNVLMLFGNLPPRQAGISLDLSL